jgi:hypothetical protein
VRRLILAAELNPWIYKEIEYDGDALWQSVLVVLLSCATSWVGVTGRMEILSMLAAACFGGLAWVVWTGLTFLIAVKLLPGPQTKATWGELLRTTGFATSPGILAVSGILPSLTGLAPFVTDIWILAAFLVAVKRTFSCNSIWRAAAVCIPGWAIYAAALFAIH